MLINKKNLIKIKKNIKFISKGLHIQQIEDWYNIKLQDIQKKLKKKNILLKNISLQEILEFIYPGIL